MGTDQSNMERLKMLAREGDWDARFALGREQQRRGSAEGIDLAWLLDDTKRGMDLGCTLSEEAFPPELQGVSSALASALWMMTETWGKGDMGRGVRVKHRMPWGPLAVWSNHGHKIMQHRGEHGVEWGMCVQDGRTPKGGRKAGGFGLWLWLETISRADMMMSAHRHIEIRNKSLAPYVMCRNPNGGPLPVAHPDLEIKDDQHVTLVGTLMVWDQSIRSFTRRLAAMWDSHSCGWAVGLLVQEIVGFYKGHAFARQDKASRMRYEHLGDAFPSAVKVPTAYQTGHQGGLVRSGIVRDNEITFQPGV